jgi:hypothetical protein
MIFLHTLYSSGSSFTLFSSHDDMSAIRTNESASDGGVFHNASDSGQGKIVKPGMVIPFSSIMKTPTA